MNFFLFIFLHLFSIIYGQSSLSNVCLMTFDNALYTSNPSYPNASILICPSSCYTMRYKTNADQYPIYGNETYSGNSLVCKSAMHDGRVAPWNGENSPVLIGNNSIQSSTFESVLRNGIISSKSIEISYKKLILDISIQRSTQRSLNIYTFLNSRINETSIMDIAIEHRRYLYSDDLSSSITCRSKSDLYPIEPINIDQGWKYWIENPLKYFTFPWNMTRDQALTFCTNNHGTLMFWNNSTEQTILQNELLTTIFQLFRYQRSVAGNDTLTFYIGLKRINQMKQWESNVINYNDMTFPIDVNSVNNNNEDYCTIIQSSGGNPSSFGIYAHRCDDGSIKGYPLCRLLPSIENEFIYRLESDTQAGNLTGVMDFCFELGGYPIYANNAYEWHLIQEIMLKDPNFNSNYVYTGLLSPSKQVTDAYWLPRNISYNSTLNYIWFAPFRGSFDRTGFHLSKANDESYYALYDINPSTTLNNLRFCRKDNIKESIKSSPSCNSKECRTEKCLNVTLPSATEDLRFGFYGCYPKNSYASIIYTHSFPLSGDFVRPNLPMDYSVALRRNLSSSLILSFIQIAKDLVFDCFEYLNFDRTGTLNDTLQLICNAANTNNKTISGITFKKSFNGLISIGLRNRRISAHHFRFIDYDDSGSRCSYQGISHPYINQCICAPGFYGTQCENSCPSGYYGQSCDYQCGGDDDYCKGLLICLPDPYGCSCYSGWYGTNCDLICPSDHYGPDCSYQCPCQTCNRFTGVCNCVGSECYQGPYSRREIESRCSSSSNLALLISVPIVSVFVLVVIIGGLLYWRKKRGSDEENLFGNSNVRFSTDSFRSSITQNQFDKDYNNILSERL